MSANPDVSDRLRDWLWERRQSRAQFAQRAESSGKFDSANCARCESQGEEMFTAAERRLLSDCSARVVDHVEIVKRAFASSGGAQVVRVCPFESETRKEDDPTRPETEL